MKPALRDVTPADVVQEGMSYEAWRAKAPMLGRVHRGIQWVIAAWILWGEQRWGERAAQAISETGLAEQTLLNILSVARAFDPSRRREHLSFAHHAALTALSQTEQDQWLDEAEKSSLSVTALRKAVAGARHVKAPVHGFASSTNAPAMNIFNVALDSDPEPPSPEVCCRDLAEHAWRVRAAVLPHCPSCRCVGEEGR